MLIDWLIDWWLIDFSYYRSIITSDFNHDGIADLAIGAPNYSKANQAQNGRVYIIYGNTDGIPDDVGDKADLDNIADVALDGIQVCDELWWL